MWFRSSVLTTSLYWYIDDVTILIYWWRHYTDILMTSLYWYVDDVTVLIYRWRHYTDMLMTSPVWCVDDVTVVYSRCQEIVSLYNSRYVTPAIHQSEIDHVLGVESRLQVGLANHFPLVVTTYYPPPRISTILYCPPPSIIWHSGIRKKLVIQKKILWKMEYYKKAVKHDIWD